MSELSDDIKRLLQSPAVFSQFGSGLKLRRYQQVVAEAILDSVVNCRGETFVVMFPRQSGKNELQAQLESYLLVLYSDLDVEIVKVSPTWKPQTQNAMRRLERVLKRSSLARYFWKKESGYIYCVFTARMIFLSGAPASSVVGATATHLLECDEAQDVGTSKWDKEFAPMAASRNATRVFWGTAWTSKTFLARELRAARQAESRDGRQRAFVLTADDVRLEVPDYGKFVDGQIARLGRNHPMVRTQFFSEEIDSEGGMFPSARQALMRGTHPPLDSPPPQAAPFAAGRGAGGEGIQGYSSVYCILLDVAGEVESRSDAGEGASSSAYALASPVRDSTALTVVEVDLSTLANDLVQAPSYRVVNRQQWVGVKHTLLYRQIIDIAERWAARHLVVDATGVGAGLTSFLDKALPGRVIPFVFTQKSKSDLGWSFLAVIETGRYKEYSTPRGDGAECFRLQQIFWQQVESCQSQILDGPGKVMRWGVPDGFRDPLTSELVHDDLLISASLVAVLDSLTWGLARSRVTSPPNLFDQMPSAF